MFSGRITPFVIASRTSATDLPEKSSRSAAPAAAAPACWPRPAALPARWRPFVAVVRLREVPDLAPDERALDERDLAPDERELDEERDLAPDDRELDEERDLAPDEREVPDFEPDERDDEPRDDEPDFDDDERDPPEREPPEPERELDEREPEDEDDERELDDPPDLRLPDEPPLPPDDSAMAVLPDTSSAGLSHARAERRRQARGRSRPNPRSTISADSPRLPRCGRSASCTATS